MTWIELIAGLLLLLGGGEALVKGSVAVAFRLGVSPMLIGLTLVGYGTSTPELVASLDAAGRGSPGIAVGNVVGSNIVNVLLILGLSALIAPISTTKKAFWRDGAVLLGASFLLFIFVLLGTLSRFVGAAFLVLLVGYTVLTYFTERGDGSASAVMHEDEANMLRSSEMPLSVGLILAFGGIAAVIFGASILVPAAIKIANTFGLSQTAVGLTLVAVGTSLPEMVVSVVAAIRRRYDVAFGNVVGSNIYNILGVTGLTALVSPMNVPSQIVRFDIWVMCGTAILLVVFAATGWRITRREGVIFLFAYAAYLTVQLSPRMQL